MQVPSVSTLLPCSDPSIGPHSKTPAAPQEKKSSAAVGQQPSSQATRGFEDDSARSDLAGLNLDIGLLVSPATLELEVGGDDHDEEARGTEARHDDSHRPALHGIV